MHIVFDDDRMLSALSSFIVSDWKRRAIYDKLGYLKRSSDVIHLVLYMRYTSLIICSCLASSAFPTEPPRAFITDSYSFFSYSNPSFPAIPLFPPLHLHIVYNIPLYHFLYHDQV